ncbi:hypothetical protein [Metabacillus sp. RGM 3146]|uniref:hypothetical protein n=1 Tax=Metabacillus sp. RGM 3146 TaxID=3401092 RepID=UPI003B9B0B3E
MKPFIYTFMLLASIFIAMPVHALSLPCSLVLNPAGDQFPNAKGAALLYKAKMTPSFPRTSISILAVHLPRPSSLGNYDSYEGFAFIPNEISWRFRLYSTPEKEDPTWAGRFDLITSEMTQARVQVRLSNSKTEKLGSSILTGSVKQCLKR